jgi:hypothetical protein
MADKIVSGEEYQAMQQSSRARPTTAGRKVTLQTRTLGLLAVVVVLCVLSFWGGTRYEDHHGAKISTSTTSGSTGGGGFGTSGRARLSGGFGQVTAVSSSSITITNQRTSASTTYTITASTTITDNGQTVTTSDIQTGDTVLIRTSGSGSTTATGITVNPSFGGGFAGQGSSDSAN